MADPICSVPGCDKPVRARGWCQGHYARHRKHGDVQADRPLNTAIPAGHAWCPQCSTLKPLAAFGVSRTRYRGVKAWCKPCEARLTATRWRESIYAQQKRWMDTNPGKATEYSRRYAEKHPEKRAALRTRLVEQRPELYAEIARAADSNRRARERNAPGVATTEQIRARWDYYGHKCWICRAPATETDHVKPLAKGGSHWPSNLRPICRTCNSQKRARWPFDAEVMRVGRQAALREVDPRALASVAIH